jgi:hypothetical protein
LDESTEKASTMKQFLNAAAMATALGALVFVTDPAAAAPMEANADDRVQLAHGMGQGAGGSAAQGGMMGPGMMGRGTMPCPGVTGRSMGSGMMGRGMSPGMMGPGMMGPDFGGRITPTKDLSADDVRHFLEHRLAWHGNKRVKLGEVKEVDDHAIVADIVTLDGSLVQRFKVDRHTGHMQQAE